MALGGSGESTNPYIVHSWDELVQAVQTTDSYSELANDIEAPSSAVNLDMSSMLQLDGKGYSINGLRCTSGNCLIMANTNKVLQNIKFTNIDMDGGDIFLATNIGNNPNSIELRNVSFSGMFESGVLTNDSTDEYRYDYTADGVGINIEVYHSAFRLMSLMSDRQMHGAFENVNAVIKYKGCSPSVSLFDESNGRKVLKNSTLAITIPTGGAKLNIGATLDNVCIHGNGSGVIIDSASGVNVVEDTIPPETSLSNVHSLTTANIKNKVYLRDTIGFPIGVD